MKRADFALYALFGVNSDFYQIPAPQKCEQSSCRAHVAAPETLSPQVQQENSQEYQPDKKSLVKSSVECQVLQALVQGVAG